MGEWVQGARVKDGAFKAYVAKPAHQARRAERWSAIQEIFGVNAVMRGKCRLAGARRVPGAVVAGPVLADQARHRPDRPDRGRVEASHRPHECSSTRPRAVKDIQATLTYGALTRSRRRLGVPGLLHGRLHRLPGGLQRTDTDAIRLRTMAAASTPRSAKPAGSKSQCFCTTR